MTQTTNPESQRSFYDQEYHFQQDVERPHESRIRSILKRLEPLEGKTYFDLGCGAGWAARLARVEGRARRVVGLDFSRTALELAHKHSPEILWIHAINLQAGPFQLKIWIRKTSSVSSSGAPRESK